MGGWVQAREEDEEEMKWERHSPTVSMHIQEVRVSQSVLHPSLQSYRWRLEDWLDTAGHFRAPLLALGLKGLRLLGMAKLEQVSSHFRDVHYRARTGERRRGGKEGSELYRRGVAPAAQRSGTVISKWLSCCCQSPSMARGIWRSVGASNRNILIAARVYIGKRGSSNDAQFHGIV